MVASRTPLEARHPSMQLLTQYLAHAVDLERLAANEKSCKFRAALLDQAAEYRLLAAKRARDLGLPAPSPPATPCDLKHACDHETAEKSRS